MKRWKVSLIFILSILAAITYYFYLPPISPWVRPFWYILMGFSGLLTLILFLSRKKRLFKLSFFACLLLCLALLFGNLLSSPVWNADRYAQLLTVEERAFPDGMKEFSLPTDDNHIYASFPALDITAAQIIAARKAGGLQKNASQFSIGQTYSHMSDGNQNYYLTSIAYDNTLKWFLNHWKGLPAYLKTDLSTQQSEYIPLENAIKYSESDFFFRNIHRYLRFCYPDCLFAPVCLETDTLETPYWVCPVKSPSIGLFGGMEIKEVILVNAITGGHKKYPADSVPDWVDNVYPTELFLSHFNSYGLFRRGYLNSILGQEDCVQATKGCGYAVMEDGLWDYTGVEGMNGSGLTITGFALFNRRSGVCIYYPVSGASEASAMEAAEGKVQHLSYQAAFPSLVNIGGEATYFVPLKDTSGLVKACALVNVAQYTILAVGDSAAGCLDSYYTILAENGITPNGLSQK